MYVKTFFLITEITGYKHLFENTYDKDYNKNKIMIYLYERTQLKLCKPTGRES